MTTSTPVLTRGDVPELRSPGDSESVLVTSTA